MGGDHTIVLRAAFEQGGVEKRYLAVVRMSRKLPEVGSVLVDQPIARHRVGPAG